MSVTVAVTTTTPNGGPDKSRTLAAATQNPVVAKASPGNVYGWAIFNSAAALQFVKLYDKATAPASTDVPVLVIPLPASNGQSVAFYDIGIPFYNGISYRIVGGTGLDADTTVATTPGVQMTLLYK